MKYKKINIEKGYEKLTEDEISSHKDFSALHKTFLHTGAKTFKMPGKFKIFTSALVTTVVVTVTVMAVKHYARTGAKTVQAVTARQIQKNKTLITQSPPAGSRAKKRFINPPIKGIDIPYKKY